MIGSASDHMRILSLLRELDAEVIVGLQVSGLDRRAFEALPGNDVDGPVLGTWAKTLSIGPVKVELYTSEPPCEVIAFPVRSKDDLRLIS